MKLLLSSMNLKCGLTIEILKPNFSKYPARYKEENGINLSIAFAGEDMSIKSIFFIL